MMSSTTHNFTLLHHHPLSVGATLLKHFSSLRPSILQLTGNSIAAAAATAAPAATTSQFRPLTSHQKQQLNAYVGSLLEWNQKMNLTAEREEKDIMERHIADSLAMIDPIRDSYLSSRCGDSCENLRVVDVGSGAGLPGLVLAIACPDWRVTLLESMNKRCQFLEHVAEKNSLSNVEVIRERAENLGQNKDYRESFDVAVGRAVADMRVLAEYCLPLVRVGGLFVAAKGHDPQVPHLSFSSRNKQDIYISFSDPFPCIHEFH
ncbi:unnamed protein product [Cuscuta campestris]|uniref:Ribosomal RNA small subunit methyltransferase G n=1 Tax=Cuscuta campestris TaxID=132261 RepID=A0A484MCI2_9ASTE|nr:unnamed protein product [Cuscuta campestris]